MDYKITTVFCTGMTPAQAALALQMLYDKTAINGFFLFHAAVSGRLSVTFTRNMNEDAEYIAERVPSGTAINQFSTRKAAIEQLYAELTDVDSDPGLADMLLQLKQNLANVENIAELAEEVKLARVMNEVT